MIVNVVSFKLIILYLDACMQSFLFKVASGTLPLGLVPPKIDVSVHDTSHH